MSINLELGYRDIFMGYPVGFEINLGYRRHYFKRALKITFKLFTYFYHLVKNYSFI